MHHLTIRCSGQSENSRRIQRITAHQDDVRCFHSHVGSGPDRNAHIRLGQSRGVVHPIPGHGYNQSSRLDFFHLTRFLMGQHLSEIFIQPYFLGNPFGHLAVISGQHHGLYTHAFQLPDGLLGFFTDNICQSHRCLHGTVDQHEHHGFPLRRKIFDTFIRNLNPLFPEISGTDNLHFLAIHLSLCPFAGYRLKLLHGKVPV